MAESLVLTSLAIYPTTQREVGSQPAWTRTWILFVMLLSKHCLWQGHSLNGLEIVVRPDGD